VNVERVIVHLTSITSYRETCNTLNRIYHRDGEDRIRPSTLSDHISSVGDKMQSELDLLSSGILSDNGFAVTDSTPESPSDLQLNLPDEPENSQELFRDTIEQYNQGKPESARIKDADLILRTETNPENCVYVSIDDVGVKHQKDTRKGGGRKEGKNVENTVIHIESSGFRRVLTAVGIDNAMKQLLALLVATGFLYTKHIRFFSDGASNIRTGLERWFPMVPYSLKLDWYHLEKHLMETLSMALFKQFRTEFQPGLFSMLWAGNVNDAVAQKFLDDLLRGHPERCQIL